MIANQPTQQPAARRRRNLTRVATLVAFLALWACCLIAMVIVVSGGRLPELNGAEQSWTPSPEQTPALAVSSPPAPAADAARFRPGDLVRNANQGPVNLRQSPGYQNKPAGDIILAVPAGQVGVVVGGPIEADGLIWWQVRFGERTGWMAERSSSGITLLDRAP